MAAEEEDVEADEGEEEEENESLEHREYWKKPSFEMSKIIGFELEATQAEET